MTKQAKTRTRLVVAIALLLVLAGCVITRSLPPGTYAATITEEDTIDFQGEWELTLVEGDHYSFARNGSIVDEGRYTLAQDQIVFTYVKGPYACPGQETYIYKWALDGKALTLTTVEDRCPDRNRVITARAWSNQN
jgi:hypothetical protein